MKELESLYETKLGEMNSALDTANAEKEEMQEAFEQKIKQVNDQHEKFIDSLKVELEQKLEVHPFTTQMILIELINIVRRQRKRHSCCRRNEPNS